jgi:hypothetical protein
MNHNPQLHIAVYNAVQILEKLKQHARFDMCRAFIVETVVHLDPRCDTCMVLGDEFKIAKHRALALTEEAEQGDCASCG